MELILGLYDDLEGCNGGMGWERGPGRDICIHIADSLHCTAEIYTTFYSNYICIKKKK